MRIRKSTAKRLPTMFFVVAGVLVLGITGFMLSDAGKKFYEPDSRAADLECTATQKIICSDVIHVPFGWTVRCKDGLFYRYCCPSGFTNVGGYCKKVCYPDGIYPANTCSNSKCPSGRNCGYNTKNATTVNCFNATTSSGDVIVSCCNPGVSISNNACVTPTPSPTPTKAPTDCPYGGLYLPGECTNVN